MRKSLRREIVKCAICETRNEFLYLNDCTYGERLALFNGGKKYAYINMLEDEAYTEFVDLTKNVIESEKLVNTDLYNIVDSIFNRACDEIDGTQVIFNGKRKCDLCGEHSFEKVLAEPESIIEVDLPEITHEKWMKYSNEEKEAKIRELIKKY
ncbi:hypothetical protein [Pseudobutyrivibrio sp.]|uniref:hypothetical protein n=1 Tax=Pseudobutyrivibrio sp. TaxID=2014367 RepID=UPI00386564CD